MDRRIIAIMAVMVLGMTTFVIPMDDSDAKTQTVYMSEFYIVHGSTVWKNDYESSYSNMLYFNEGSENHKTMLKYLEDGKTPVLKDDRDNLSGNVHLYMMTTWSMDTTIYIYVRNAENVLVPGEIVKEPFNNSFFVKAGDTFRFHASSIKDMYGNTSNAYIGSTDILNDTYVETAKTSKEISLRFDYSWSPSIEYHSLFFIVDYEVSGQSEPNGSATVFIALCAVMAVIGLGLLIIAAIKPKWSK